MCARVCVCVCVNVHAGTLLYRSITWASDCAISPVSPLCSPRRLILPGGMVLMWEAGRGGGEQGRAGDYTHYLSESSSDHTAAILYLLSADFNI